MEDKFSVWVGSLSLNVKEETLSDFFGKFGPLKSVVIMRDELGKSRQFGYVNYYSRELAECAATVMDGCKLLGQTIKTKGPSELQKLRNEQNFGGTRKDYRLFTDCLFFIDGRECTWKSGECPFRHCNNAKKTENVCEKWLERCCEELKCPHRHPRLTKSPAINTDHTINRCASHNAFKCFGECGNKDCSTHFLEHSAYLEHVKMATKKLVQPVDTCVLCQAVFFIQEEKINHRCYKNGLHPPRSGVIPQFTSTRVQAEKDIAHPQPSYPNRTHVTNPNNIHQPIYTQRTNRVISTDINKIDKKYSSSSKENERISNILSNQENRTNTITTTGRPWTEPSKNFNCINSANNVKSSNELEPVGVFWDFENCAVPKGKSAQAVVQKIRSVFFKEKREVEFMCVCDTSKEKRAVIEELNKAQVTVVHINATSKNAADDKLRQSLRRFAQTYSRPATVILISGDGNFAMDLSDLRHRHNFQVICLHYVAASSALLGFAHQTQRFDLFTEDLPTSAQTPFKPSYSNDVLVTNLPPTKSTTVLKARLAKLSDNCGGKVVAIDGNKAIVRFPNTEAAFRARRRLDKEDMFGYILLATLLPATNNNECGEMTVGKRKQKENSSFGVSPGPSTSPIVKPLMNLNLINANTKSWKENQSPNCVDPAKSFPNENVRQKSLPLRFPEPPAIMSPQFPGQFAGQRFAGFHGHVMYNNMFHPSLVHSMFGMQGGTPRMPSSPVPSAPSPLSPVVNVMVRRSPSPEQQFNGVDLLVTNINESVSKKEIKKKLASVFREHCKVYSVVLHAKNGAPLRAFVKVPKLMDAHLAIPKVTGKVILGQIVHVSIASEKDKELCYLQDEAVSVLQEAPLNWLPLSTFFANFEKKYRRRLDARHLEQIQDIVEVNGSAGCQTVSLLEGKLDSELVVVDGNSFSSDVFKLLHHFDGVIALASFPALYWLEFHKEFKLCSTGSVLEKLLCSVPNVTVVGTAGKRSVQWARKPASTPCDLMDLSLLSSQLVDILQLDHEFEMTFERLRERYQSCYDKELEPFSYGFQSLADLLYSLTTIVQVTEDPTESYVCLRREYRVKMFQKEMTQLLQQQPRHSVLLSNFMAAYVKHFGQKFKLSSFGFNRLTDLVKAVSGVAEIEGIGDQRTVTLVHKKDEEFSQQQKLHLLTCEIKTLLNDSDLEEINVNCLLDNYNISCFTSVDCDGRKTLDDVLARLSSTFQVVRRGDEKFLRLHEIIYSVNQVKKDLVVLLNDQESKMVCVRNIFKLYENCFHRKFPYEVSLLNEALDSLEKPLEVRGNGNTRIIVILNEENQSGVDFVFVKTAVEVFYHSGGYSLPKLRFQRIYEQNIRKNKNIVEDEERLASPSCVVLRQEGNEVMAELKRSYLIRILIEELKQLLTSTDDLSLSLDGLPTRYEEYFQKKFNLESHGLSCMRDFKDTLNGFLEITSSGNTTDQNDRISLAPVSRFELETKTLLDSCGGCLPLSRFAPVYQQMYSKPCVVSGYGYTKLSSLINAVPHVARIIGSGPEKVVLAVQRSIPEKVCSDMLSIRIIGGSTEEICSAEKDGHVSHSGAQALASCKLVSDETNLRNSNLSKDKPYSVRAGSSDEAVKMPESLPNDQRLPKPLKAKTSPADTELHSPGREKTEKANNISSGERSNVRATSSRVRLAANFAFPLNKKK